MKGGATLPLGFSHAYLHRCIISTLPGLVLVTVFGYFRKLSSPSHHAGKLTRVSKFLDLGRVKKKQPKTYGCCLACG